ncbi:hypothetical protein U9M48_021364 [Paspalum notatum var. saurae]|uniref:Uncharacterized protein n=1 Tax=Paspalum notatum var. saurae TaxID=547442 RepID=A0AAQ3TGK0_PASNO
MGRRSAAGRSSKRKSPVIMLAPCLLTSLSQRSSSSASPGRRWLSPRPRALRHLEIQPLKLSQIRQKGNISTVLYFLLRFGVAVNFKFTYYSRRRTLWKMVYAVAIAKSIQSLLQGNLRWSRIVKQQNKKNVDSPSTEWLEKELLSIWAKEASCF